MKELKCEVNECNVTLNSIPEVGTGLCDRHHSALSDKGNYAVICDSCTNIHAIEPSPLQYGVLVFRDKYVYVESCPQCSKTSSGEDWLNKPDRGELSDVVLGVGVTLNPDRQGLMAGAKRNSRIKSGSCSLGTGDQDIFAKIKLSPKEADHNLSNFFDNLDYGELDHGN